MVEIKHWDRAFLPEKRHTVEAEAIKLNNKIRRLVAKVRRVGFDPGFVAGRVLLTKDDEPWKFQEQVA